MMKRPIGLCLSILLCGALLAAAGCGAQPTPADTGSRETAAAGPTTAAQTTEATRPPTEGYTTVGKTTQRTKTTGKVTPATATVKTQAPDKPDLKGGHLNGLKPVSSLPQTFRQGYARFASALTQQLYQDGKNLFYAPASVYLALGMTANGAGGSTAAQMCRTLGVADIAALNAGCRDLQSLLSGNQEGYFQLANAMWFDKNAGFALKSDFVKANAAYYGAELTVRPFDKALIPAINQWVADHTGGHIRDLLTPPLDANAFLFLVNTLLFEGSWTVPFAESYTQEGTFHGVDGDVRIPLMQQTLHDDAYWYEDALVQATTLGYADGRTAMLIALPKTDMKTVVQSLKADTIETWVKGMDKCNSLSLKLPRFQLSYRAELQQALAAMGMAEAFDMDKADFNKMADPAQDIWIQKVLHQTALEVTENGTMAAAATAVEMWAKATKPSGENHVLCVDRPFFCAIVDKTTGAVIFTGVVNQPQALKK